jgi:hypothetical protein
MALTPDGATMEEIIESCKEVLAEESADKCKSKYIDPKTGRFKGKTGERFDNCVRYMKCKGDVDDPEAVCAAIARKKGLVPGQKEDVEYGPDDIEEMLQEAEQAQKATIAKAADAMVTSPAASRLLGKLPLTGYEMQLRQTIEALLTHMLALRGVRVSGGSQAMQTIRALGKGTMPGE